MIASPERAARKTFNLVICERPCAGPAYVSAPRLPFSNKTEARAYCAAHGIQPWNF
ncbi:hypothetical protein MKK88_02565 [Methylobacterium sp. E-005]|uniref:hypothetical protein n=1 Tax=Methylobacterium sp. E-005 TaxID=2836549 RepID=UPI001FBB3EC5|nr:hypothetical protein [Methylobacterium sp. E-005]MCJ2084877.1 hypothetical protein [Methylobacterium sp. E-005]